MNDSLESRFFLKKWCEVAAIQNHPPGFFAKNILGGIRKKRVSFLPSFLIQGFFGQVMFNET